MFWSHVSKGLSSFLDWRVWVVISLSLCGRAILMAAAGQTSHHVSKFHGRLGKILDKLLLAITDGAFMFLMVILLFPVLHASDHASFLPVIRQAILPALVVGVTDAVVVGLVFLLLSLVPGLKRLSDHFPSVKLFLEGALLFEFCLVEFAKYTDMKFVPGLLVSNLTSTIRDQQSLIHYPAGFLAVGLLIESAAILALARLHAALARQERPWLRPAVVRRFSVVFRGLMGGLVPLLMYIAMTEM